MSDKNLPPPNRVPRGLNGLRIVSYAVGSWCPDQEGKAPPEAVGLSLLVDWNSQQDLYLTLRLNTPAAVDMMIAALRRHRHDVWPNHKEQSCT